MENEAIEQQEEYDLDVAIWVRVKVIVRPSDLRQMMHDDFQTIRKDALKAAIADGENEELNIAVYYAGENLQPRES